jgi:hypothetical protein
MYEKLSLIEPRSYGMSSLLLPPMPCGLFKNNSPFPSAVLHTDRWQR